jgi:RNA polymerase sigma-70 factor (ECF subfamily)
MDDLIQRAQAGDHEAFGEIVQRTAADVRAFIAAFCPSAAQIDDLAQETYVRAYQALKNYTHEGLLVAWLRGIARNVVFEDRRNRRREAPLEGDTLNALVDARIEQRTASSDLGRRVDSLKECLDRVSGTSRQLLEDFYVKEHTSEDIAQSLGRTASWVRVSLLRVKRKLAECVEAKLSTSRSG